MKELGKESRWCRIRRKSPVHCYHSVIIFLHYNYLSKCCNLLVQSDTVETFNETRRTHKKCKGMSWGLENFRKRKRKGKNLGTKVFLVEQCSCSEVTFLHFNYLSKRNNSNAKFCFTRHIWNFQEDLTHTPTRKYKERQGRLKYCAF